MSEKIEEMRKLRRAVEALTDSMRDRRSHSPPRYRRTRCLFDPPDWLLNVVVAFFLGVIAFHASGAMGPVLYKAGVDGLQRGARTGFKLLFEAMRLEFEILMALTRAIVDKNNASYPEAEQWIRENVPPLRPPLNLTEWI